MPRTGSSLLVQDRSATVPASVAEWACSALDALDAPRSDMYPRYPHTADTGLVILDVLSLLALARDAAEDPDLPTPPREALAWLRLQARTAERERAARFVWVHRKGG